MNKEAIAQQYEAHKSLLDNIAHQHEISKALLDGQPVFVSKLLKGRDPEWEKLKSEDYCLNFSTNEYRLGGTIFYQAVFMGEKNKPVLGLKAKRKNIKRKGRVEENPLNKLQGFLKFETDETGIVDIIFEKEVTKPKGDSIE